MRVSLKENIIFESFNNKKDMMEKILKMIMVSEIDKVLYKGNPEEINYKLMKKKKGLSADEKGDIMLKIFHNRLEVFNFKEIEKFSVKAGISFLIRFSDNKRNTRLISCR